MGNQDNGGLCFTRDPDQGKAEADVVSTAPRQQEKGDCPQRESSDESMGFIYYDNISVYSYRDRIATSGPPLPIPSGSPSASVEASRLIHASSGLVVSHVPEIP